MQVSHFLIFGRVALRMWLATKILVIRRCSDGEKDNLAIVENFGSITFTWYVCVVD